MLDATYQAVFKRCLLVLFAVMEIGFEKTNYVFSEAAVVPLCVKIYSGQLATELALKVQSYDESAHGLRFHLMSCCSSVCYRRCGLYLSEPIGYIQQRTYIW